jgi:non-SMC mitotic condensation complex subunit 1
MRRVFRATMLVLGVVVLAGLCWYFLRPGARRIQGRTRDEWIAGLAKGMSAADIEQWRSLGPQAVPLLVRALRTGDSPEERWYRDHWYNLPTSLKKHLAFPQDPASIRINAALVLGCLTVDISDAAPALGRALRDEKPDVRVNASLVLKGLVPKLAPAAKAQLVPDLLAALKDQNYLVRQNMIQCLGECPEESRLITPELARACDDTVQVNSYLATRSLKKMDPVEAAKGDAPTALMHCLVSSDTQVCMIAAEMLSTMKCDPRREVAAFTEMLGDYRPARQRIGAVALGKYGAEAVSAVPALQRALEMGEPRVRAAASNSLQQIQPPASK